jgi:hypothetical protein
MDFLEKLCEEFSLAKKEEIEQWRVYCGKAFQALALATTFSLSTYRYLMRYEERT